MTSVKAILKVQYLLNNRNSGRWSKNPQEISLIELREGVFKIRLGTKTKEFKLTNNIDIVYDELTHEGRATLQLKSPQMMIYLSEAVGLDMKQFMDNIRRIERNETVDMDEIVTSGNRESEEFAKNFIEL